MILHCYSNGDEQIGPQLAKGGVEMGAVDIFLLIDKLTKVESVAIILQNRGESTVFISLFLKLPKY